MRGRDYDWHREVITNREMQTCNVTTNNVSVVCYTLETIEGVIVDAARDDLPLYVAVSPETMSHPAARLAPVILQ